MRLAHEVDDDVDALAARSLLDLVCKVLRLVVDRVRRATRKAAHQIELLGRRRRRRDRVTVRRRSVGRKPRRVEHGNSRAVEPRQLNGGDAHAGRCGVDEDVIAFLDLSQYDQGLERCRDAS